MSDIRVKASWITKIDAEITRLRAENEKLREALIDTTASLVASVSLLERGGKKAAPSDKMFAQMLVDYKNSIDRARTAIEGVTEPVALWQHKKTGGVYEIVGECQIEATNAPGVLYRNTSTGVTWMRPKEEFFDGRFVEWRKSEPSK